LGPRARKAQAARIRSARQIKKARPDESERAFAVFVRAWLFCGDGLFFVLLFRSFLGRCLPRFLVLLFQLRADEFEDCELGAVSDAPSGADYPRVTSLTFREARSQIGEKLLGGVRGHEERGGLTPGVKRIALAESDHALGD